MAVAPTLNLSLADGCLATLPASFASKTSTHPLILFRKKPIRFLGLSSSCFSLSFTPFALSLAKKKVPLVVSLVARTSDWARQDEEAAERGDGENDFAWEGETKEFGLLEEEGTEVGFSDWEKEDQEGADVAGDVIAEEEGTEVGFSDWEKEDQEGADVAGDVIAEGDSPLKDEFLERGDDSFSEPPEEAKLFVGNLPYDVDSEKLAHLFEKAGIVEVAEVLYNRETGQSRGFGFVNMSNVEEAERAVEMFSRYDCNGRILTVNKASPRGTLPERSPREFEPSARIYVGNLPWQVDESRLEQLFSEHGKVVNARVVYDRETGRSRGFGFVTMASKSEHDDAIEALDGQTMDGRAIRVNVAEERPRRGSF